MAKGKNSIRKLHHIDIIGMTTIMERLAIVAANNHYAGFGHGTINTFRNMCGVISSQMAREERRTRAATLT